MTLGWVTDRAIWVRLGMAAVLIGYMAIISASYFVPLPPLEFPLAFIGWLFLPGLYVWGRLLRIDTRRSAQPPIRELVRPWALTAVFGALVAIALFLAIGWDVPNSYHGPVPVNCFQGYQWSTENGRYSHTIANGTHGEISQRTYVQELGFDLRSASAFGIFAMCLAFLAAGVLRAPSKP